MNKIVLLGGDVRQDHLASVLRKKGYETACAWTPLTAHLSWKDVIFLLQESHCILLPLPVTKDGIHLTAVSEVPQLPLQALLTYIPASVRTLGGLVPVWLRQKGIEEYYSGEELLCANAASTAEGAIGLTVVSVPFTLRGSSCAVTGCGRIGSRLALLLKGMGAKVTVYARSRTQREWAISHDIAAAPLTDLPDGQADILYNTIPHPILSGTDPILTGETWYMELASSPGGGIAPADTCHYIAAASLPGRFAPITAAADLAAALESILEGSER